jgi:hypothetical protein
VLANVLGAAAPKDEPRPVKRRNPMRVFICFAGAVAFCAMSGQADAKAAPKLAAFQLNHTTWTFMDKGKRVRESIDEDGNYIENTAGGKHLDHGTVVMKDRKACFTSAMTNEGELCWTTPRRSLAVGRSFVTRSDKGRKLKVTRVRYTKLSMPK